MDTFFIADDEASARENLKYIIDWESLGFHLCGEAANGEDALSKILTLNPSLSLLDIRMPKMCGTEVIRRAREAGYQGKCIILSGHLDFQYAQEAIRSGVSCYLAKPLNRDELYTAVSEVQKTLLAEQRHSNYVADLQNRVKDIILHELITDTLSAPLSADVLDHFHLKADVYQIVVCEDFHTHSAAASYTFAELFRVVNRDNNIFEHLSDNSRDIVLLKGRHGLNKLSEFIEHFNSHPLQEGSPMESMFLTYGRPVYTLQNVHLSYKDATRLLARRFFCAQGQHVLGYTMLPSESDLNHLDHSITPPENVLSDFSERFIDYIQSGNRGMVIETLSELESRLACASGEITDIKLFLTDLYFQIKEAVNRNYTSIEIPFMSNVAVIEYINSRNYLYEIIKFLLEQFEMIIGAIGNPSGNTILDDVLFYIDHNFQNNIKLETIASLFGYSSTYLGRIFNKTIGENFNSYIDHKRIELSKLLLQENRLKVYEIADQVGYKNVNYFHKKFKKYVGESPAEFRKGLGLDTESGKYPPPEKNRHKEF